MARGPHIVLAGGGTPGRLFSGLAVASHLVERIPDATISFVGSGRPQERHPVTAAGFGYTHLPSRPAPMSALHAVRFVTDNVAGYWACRWHFREKNVALVVGLGGAASAPAIRAGMARGIPTVLLEPNVSPGRVTRWLANRATAVCLGFNEARAELPSAAAIVPTGNPARSAFERLYRQRESWTAGYCALDSEHDAPIFWERRPRNTSCDPNSTCERRLVVIGGAAGARSLNVSLPSALARLGDELRGWQIVHQSGEGQLRETEQRYREAGVDALVVAFIDEMAPVMFDSDLAICRAGGTTLAELALAGLPAVLVPYPPVADFHLPNAEYFASRGAATIIEETASEASLADELVRRLKPLLSDRRRRQQMAARMRDLAQPDAASNVTDTVCDALHGVRARAAA